MRYLLIVLKLLSEDFFSLFLFLIYTFISHRHVWQPTNDQKSNEKNLNDQQNKKLLLFTNEKIYHELRKILRDRHFSGAKIRKNECEMMEEDKDVKRKNK